MHFWDKKADGLDNEKGELFLSVNWIRYLPGAVCALQTLNSMTNKKAVEILSMKCIRGMAKLNHLQPNRDCKIVRKEDC